MITPLDIQNKEFPKGVRGYKEEEVDGFLDLVTMDMERLITENAKLREDSIRLETELQKYKGSEDSVLETLEAAKALMGDISASAEKRAEILLKNAELDAELIQREARESVERLTEESISLRNRFTAFQSKYKSMLESELERFDTLSTELFS
ncbi:MAG: DivIVA domain-containing protein, partial [Anaerovorax sp.]